MKIHLCLFANIRKYHPTGNGDDRWTAPDGITVGRIRPASGIPEQYVKIIFVNGVKADKDTVLRDGDRVGVFPPLACG